MAERAPPADPPGPQFMAEKLARLDADIHLLLDAAQSSRMGAAASSKRWRSASSRASFSAMNCGPGGSAGGARSAMGGDASSLAAYPNPQV